MVARIGRTHFEKCESFVHPWISQLQLSHPMTVPVMPLNEKFESLWKVTWHDKLGLNEVGGIWRKKYIQNVQKELVVILTFDCSISKLKNKNHWFCGSNQYLLKPRAATVSMDLQRIYWSSRSDLFWNPNPEAVGVYKTGQCHRGVAACRHWRGWSCAECEHFWTNAGSNYELDYNIISYIYIYYIYTTVYGKNRNLYALENCWKSYYLTFKLP